MRVLASYRPTNPYLRRPVDARWRQWLTRYLLGATAVGITLAAVVGPRQENVRLRYEMAVLQQEVARLERQHSQLLLEREALTSPEVLKNELPDLSLELVGPDRIAYLTPDHRLVPVPTRPPAAVRPRQKAAEPH